MDLNKIGKKKYMLPVVAVIIFFCIFSLVVYPILNAEPSDLPMAIVSLDEGAQTPMGDMNLGDQMVEKVTGPAEMPIAWSIIKGLESLEKAFENNEYYGALVIPENFTQLSAAAQSGGEVEAPTLKIIINQGKSPMVASIIQPLLTSNLVATGADTEIETINTANLGGSPMSGMMGMQMTVMPFFMMNLVCSVILYLATRGDNQAIRNKKVKILVVQIGFIAVLSLIVSSLTVLMISAIGGLSIPVGTTILFLWFASFCILLLFVGALDILAPLGAIFLALTFSCGMSTGFLPAEMLPTFWKDWIYPWAPQRYVADGVREIIYMGSGAWGDANLAFIIIGCAGIVLMAISIFIPRKQDHVVHP